MNWTPVHGPGSRSRRDAVGTSDDGGPVIVYYNPATNGWRAGSRSSACIQHYQGVQLIAARRAGGMMGGQLSCTLVSDAVARLRYNNFARANAGTNDPSTGGVSSDRTARSSTMDGRHPISRTR